MPILYTSAPVTPPDLPTSTLAAPPRILLELTYVGADGSEWVLTSPSSQVRLLPGMRGLEAGPIDRWTSEAAGIAGARYRGHRALPREVFLPVYITGQGSEDWLAVRRAWDAGLSPDTEGQLVAVVAGQRRTLPCRWSETEAGWSRDPLYAGKAVLGEKLIADGAYWQGEDVVRQWIAEDPADFFMAADGVLHITPSNTLGSARMDNPGDVAAWPVWTIAGPFDEASLGVDGAEIEVPFAMTAGQWLRIDTRPDRQTVVDHTGADRVADLGAVAFRRIPARMSAPVTIEATGTSAGFSAAASLTPLYRRAW